MFEELGGQLDGNLNGASSALANDLASGDAGQFKVDLQALYDYFYGVYDILDKVEAQTKRLPSDPYYSACLADSQIPGVSAAIEATVDAALGTASMSMAAALQNVKSLLAKHLTAVKGVYTAYVHADTEGATELTQASNARAANYTLQMPVSVGSVPGMMGHDRPM